ncbi:hypothetical protein B0H63DRAFT_485660 [Podospora didyma]|uniref:Uncharacterized protein n=1 Tax=Podospora didyma TaxID=330526 RepID=A0AAE0K4A0_9PEZI|nr:hypothetical protein B0H63DRAFT_485660 [Podospora didyma]
MSCSRDPNYSFFDCLLWVEKEPGYIAEAVIIGALVIPLAVVWGISLRSIRAQHAAPLRMSQIFLRAAPPVFFFAVLCLVTSLGLTVSYFKGEYFAYKFRATQARQYLSVFGAFLYNTAAILIAASLSLSTLSALYLSLLPIVQEPFWKVLQIAIPLTALLVPFSLIVALFGINVDDLNYYWAHSQRRSSSGRFFTAPLALDIVVELVHLVVALGALIITIYARSKLRKAGMKRPGKLTNLLITTSILWLLRSSYTLAMAGGYSIRPIFSEQTTFENTLTSLYKGEHLRYAAFVNPFLNLWLAATVLALLTLTNRRFPPAAAAVPIFVDKTQGLPQQDYPHQQYLPQQPPQTRQFGHDLALGHGGQ